MSNVGRLREFRSKSPDAPFPEVLTQCHPESHSSLVELACLDIIERLRHGSNARVEDYTRTVKRLDSADAILDLLDAELCVRRELGETPNADELTARFPNLRDEVARLFEIDDIEQQINTPAPVESAPLPEVPGFQLAKELWSDSVSTVFRARSIETRSESLLRLFADGSRDDKELAQHIANAIPLRHPSILRITHFNAFEARLFYAVANSHAVPLREVACQPVAGRMAAEWAQSISSAAALATIEQADLGVITDRQIVLDHTNQPRIIGFGATVPKQPSEPVTAFGKLLFKLLSSADIDAPHEVTPSHPAYTVTIDPALEKICAKCLGTSQGPQYVDIGEIVDDLTAYLINPPPSPAKHHAGFVQRMLQTG